MADYTFADALAALQTSPETLDASLSYGLSDLSTENLEVLIPVWEKLDEVTQLKIIHHLVEISESNFEFDYSSFGHYLLRSSSVEIRQTAIELLWGSQSIATLELLMELAVHDTENAVRATSIGELGRFVLLGEYEEIPKERNKALQKMLLGFWTDANESIQVRSRALESVSNCSHDAVSGFIREAYRSDNHQLKLSAIYAMGRSCDSDTWSDIVLSHLDDGQPEFQYQAIHAAGMLELDESIKRLAVIAAGEDVELQTAAIWALGEIGGEDALVAIQHLREHPNVKDNEELDVLLDDAEDNAQLSHLAFGDLSDLDID